MGRTVAAEIEKLFAALVDDDAKVVGSVAIGSGPGLRLLDGVHWLLCRTAPPCCRHGWVTRVTRVTRMVTTTMSSGCGYSSPHSTQRSRCFILQLELRRPRPHSQNIGVEKADATLETEEAWGKMATYECAVAC